MDLIKCPICGEEYSPSYHTCPFCEESDESPVKRRAPKRHITTKKSTQSARSGIVVVGVLVMLLLGWYLFGDKLPRGEKAPGEATEESVLPAQSGKSDGAGESAAVTEPGDSAEGGDAAGTGESAAPAEETPTESAVHVDAAALDIKTNVSGVLPKDPMTGYYDCSLKKTENIQLIVIGTEVPVSDWSSENTGVVSVDSEGRLTPAGSGTTNVTATVGDAKVTCIVRVR
ncbi:MAG: Ig-like domain-containing protein [Oscillospiraceae bacterium]|nr:Ig-like domain-containing protein [Oscillospiraceae bacterium]